jgi:hypothetical protein
MAQKKEVRQTGMEEMTEIGELENREKKKKEKKQTNSMDGRFSTHRSSSWREPLDLFVFLVKRGVSESMSA